MDGISASVSKEEEVSRTTEQIVLSVLVVLVMDHLPLHVHVHYFGGN